MAQQSRKVKFYFSTDAAKFNNFKSGSIAPSEKKTTFLGYSKNEQTPNLRPGLSEALFAQRSGAKKRECFDRLSINSRRIKAPKSTTKLFRLKTLFLQKL